MIDASSFEDLQTLFETINYSIEESEDNDDVSASELFQYLGSKNPKQVIFHNPENTETSVDRVSNFADAGETWPCVAGLDSSNTRTIRLDSGEVITASIAAFGIDGDEKRGLKQHRTLNAVIFSFNPDLEIQESSISTSETTTAEILKLPPGTKTNQIESWVQGISLLHSEFTHPNNVSTNLDIPLLIDGPLYSGNFFWYARHKYNKEHSHNTGTDQLGTPLNTWTTELMELMQERVNTIEHYYDNRLPLAGVVKTTSSSSVLSSIRDGIPNASFESPHDESDVRWPKDMTFFNELLTTHEEQPHNEPTISHTPWLEEQYTVVSEAKINFFENNTELDLSLPESAYRKVFFYVKVPYKGYCLRIESPKCLVDVIGEEIRSLVLYQIAADAGVPGPIVFADSDVEISESTRDKLRKQLSNSSPDSHNERREHKPGTE